MVLVDLPKEPEKPCFKQSEGTRLDTHSCLGHGILILDVQAQAQGLAGRQFLPPSTTD